MNGKPQLVFGQAQLSGSDTLMNKAHYAKSSLLPVNKGNSFASILSSTVDKSAPASTPVAGKLMPGGQGSFLGGAASLFGANTAQNNALQANALQVQAPQGNASKRNTRQTDNLKSTIPASNARQADIALASANQGSPQTRPAQGSAVTKIGGATVQAATQANTVSKRVSVIPKNYSFGMEDTRPGALRSGARSVQPPQPVESIQSIQSASGTVKKTPAASRTTSSARAINVTAMQGKSSGGMSSPITEQFVAGNGTYRDTPYRGLSISRSGTDKAMMNSLHKKGGAKGGFYSPLLAGGATQLLMQIVKEVGHVAGAVNDRLHLKKGPALTQPQPVVSGNASHVPHGKQSAQLASSVQKQGSSAHARAAFGNQQTISQQVVRQQGVRQQDTATPAGVASGPQQTSGTAHAMTMDVCALGALSAKFESGENGIAAIGYDWHGGTSYGKYQISSRAGTFSKFLEYLEVNAPDIGAKLRAGGPANTGGRRGKMPDVWKSVAESEPERFEQLQTDFIMGSHFQPAMSAITEATGLAFGAMPEALREVVFSTAVQHGVSGAAKIVSRAVASVGAEKLTDGEKAFVERTGQDLIRQIYNIRAGQFSSSTSTVRRAVQSRLQHEMHDALALLRVNTIPQRPDTRRTPIG